MVIWLGYKEYPYKMSLAAIKQFKDATGLDLWHTLLCYINAYRKTSGISLLEQMEQLTAVCDFATTAKLFHCLIKQENKSIPLSEIEDAMFRVGWRSNDEDDEKSRPYPLIAVLLAFDIDNAFCEVINKKKSGYLGASANNDTPAKFFFDYWGYFRFCVTELNIAPSEAWYLDFIEIKQLINNESESEFDLTFMLNYEREQNGASKEWLAKN